ncbi:MAG: UDP-glucose--hexose-1-phosphate uridylyltransferase [Lachnospirales bacterium]
MDIYLKIEELVNYGISKNLIEESDKIFVKNILFDFLQLKGKCIPPIENNSPLTATKILDDIFEYATEKNICDNTITEKDLFTTKIMGVLTPRPSEVIEKFNRLYSIDKKDATEYFYNLNKDSNYIMVDRVKQNLEWDYESKYGTLNITINVSKPEKDPKDIEKAKAMKSSNYPSCLLCIDNIGFKGNLNHPARQNLRIIPLNLNNENWSMQYSPYVYYNEHCIVFNNNHIPMTGNSSWYKKLIDFVDFLPHYFIGSNAGIPVVGGSILSHDHFQGGKYDMPMAKASTKATFTHKDYKDLKISIVNWPMSVVRITGENREEILSFSEYLHKSWSNYSNNEANILSHTNDTPHNAITPILRKNIKSEYEMDLVLRNNITTDEYPLGLFHPHSDIHHIKKENIGLIEVLGLGVLPKRLVEELEEVKSYLLSEEKNLDSFKDNIHYLWTLDLIEKFGRKNTPSEVEKIINDGVGQKFERCLIDAGVFKDTTEGIKFFKEFLVSMGLQEI